MELSEKLRARIRRGIANAHLLGSTYADCKEILGRPVQGPPRIRNKPAPQPAPVPESKIEARRKERAAWWRAIELTRI